MNLGENIREAFDIVAKTYENVNKLMEYCRAKASEKGEFVLSTPKFLRWKSDVDVGGWLISSFILLFQNAKDQLLESNWRNGSVYVLEINLYEPQHITAPIVNIAKFEYVDIESWSEGCSTSDHWVLYHPLYGENVEFEQDGANYTGYVVNKDDADKRFWGLRKITGIEVPLTEITNENAYETIFGGFRSLMDK
jgi:hypothetical protein